MDHAYRLLAVDDEPEIQRTNRRYLEARGYRIDTAACGKEALALLKRYNYDGILLDVMLPDVNGFVLCKTVRELTSAPILFLSCMDDEESRIRGRMAGGDDYITKPCSLKDLEARVYAQIRQKAEVSKNIYNEGGMDHDKKQKKEETISGIAVGGAAACTADRYDSLRRGRWT